MSGDGAGGDGSPGTTRTEECYHLGHYLLDGLKQNPERIAQIDAATGEQETNGGLLARTVRLARSLRRAGLAPGAVLAFGGRNHRDLHLPYYAALLNGLPAAGIDPFFKFAEIKDIFKILEPKIVFCDEDSYEETQRACAELGLEARVVTYGEGEHSLRAFLDEFRDDSDEEFRPARLAPRQFAWLVSTSGSTGRPKVAAHRHADILQYIAFVERFRSQKPHEMGFHLSPPQWISAYFNALWMVTMHITKLQTSRAGDIEHYIDIINQYKPSLTAMNPSVMAAILKSEKHCDLTCFDLLILAGSKAPPALLAAAKARAARPAAVLDVYGQSETLGSMFMPAPSPPAPPGNVGTPLPSLAVKLVDPETLQDITAPHTIGELWVKGLRFTEYYREPAETARAITPDGWLRSGDLLYRDEGNHFFFVDRLKALLKFRGTHIMPSELEEVIRTHPGVEQVVVTGAEHPEDGERPLAVVVTRLGHRVSAADIKQLVASRLHAHKQLSGGVVFVPALPLTSTGKLDRAALRALLAATPAQ